MDIWYHVGKMLSQVNRETLVTPQEMQRSRMQGFGIQNGTTFDPHETGSHVRLFFIFPSVSASSKRLPLFFKVFYLRLEFELLRFKQTVGNTSTFRSPGMADVNEQVDQEIQDAPGDWDCMKQYLYFEFRSIIRCGPQSFIVVSANITQISAGRPLQSL